MKIIGTCLGNGIDCASGEITQSSIKAVESRLYRARKELRSSLAGWHGS